MGGWGRCYRARSGRRMSRPVGCLVWVLALIIVLLILSAVFGGFQRGSRVSGAQTYSRSDINVLCGLSS